LDLTLTTDLTTAGQSGDLNQTIDYAAVFRRVEALCTGRSFHLLEEVGHQICKAILSEFPVEKVKLKIRKLIPFSVRLSAVGIELKRYRKKQRRD
jgi:dihydroneopterin aldolase